MTKQHYDGIAGIYDANRPAYPPDLVRHFCELCPIPEGGGIIPEGGGIIPEDGGIILDVGSGTGISTRQLRQLFPTTSPSSALNPATTCGARLPLTSTALLSFSALSDNKRYTYAH